MSEQLADKNKDGEVDTVEAFAWNKDNPNNPVDVGIYQAEQQSEPNRAVLAAPQGDEQGANVGTSTSSDILWNGTITKNPQFKGKTAVKNAYVTRTLEPSILNQIDTYYQSYGKTLGFKSASSFWNNVVEQSGIDKSPWTVLSEVKNAVESGVALSPDGGQQLSAAELKARRELQAMQVALSKDPEADLTGEAGKFQETLTKYSDAMGLLKSRKEVNTYVKNIIEGKVNPDAVTDEMRKQAEILYSNFADRLRSDASLTVRDLVNPYLQVMADTLEIDPQLVKLTDPTIQNAISGSKLRSLTDFRIDMRNDPRFATTRTAKREATNLAQSLLKGFGFSI